MQTHAVRATSESKTWPEGPLEFHARLNSAKSHDAHGLDIFRLSSYTPMKSLPDSGMMHLRHASRDAKVELENTFLSTNTFRFCCPKVLNHFLSELSVSQRLLLRSITVKLFACRHCTSEHGFVRSRRSWLETVRRAWVDTIERLPATLHSVVFDLGRGNIMPFSPSSSYHHRQFLIPALFRHTSEVTGSVVAGFLEEF